LLDIRLIVALVFGALISATDPVAVVALFKELGAPKRLMVLVEGESLLNDATAIVAFSILVGIAASGGSIGWGDSGPIIWEFLRVFIGGVIVGSLLGFAVCEVVYRMRSDLPVILTTSIVIAYASFVLSEHVLHVSGVMSVVGSAIALKRYSILRFGHEAMHSIHSSWEVIVLSLNSLLFLLVGLSVKIENVPAMLGAIFVVVLLILGARAISIYNLLPITTKIFHLPRVSMADRHIMWWGGLKGGLAIAVVLSIPDSLPEKQYLFDLTIGVVMFTFLVADTIVGESERGDNFYILIHGTATVLKLDEEGASQQITEFHDGDIIGESSLLEQEKSRHRRSATIVAKTACNLVSIPRKAMLSIVENYPEIRQQLQMIHDDRINAAE